MLKLAEKHRRAAGRPGSKRHSRLFERLVEFRLSIAGLLLVALLLYDLAYSLVFIGGPSYFGDDVSYMGLAHNVLAGTFGQSAFDTHSVRLLQVFPIAFFLELSGFGLYSDSAWDVTGFLGSVAVAFFMAKELYNERAGLIAAALLSFFPGLLQLASTASDNPPLMFIASLAMLAILYGERRSSKSWYFAGGALVVASPLVSPEGYIMVLVAFAYLFIELLRKKIRIDHVSLYFVYGILAAGALLSVANYLTTRPPNPFITIAGTGEYYISEAPPYPSPDLAYLPIMFPSLSYTPINNTSGYYFYVFAAAVIYICGLYIIRRKNLIKMREWPFSYLMFLWPLVVFLYLSFGPIFVRLDPFGYILIDRLSRYLLLFMVPVVVTIGIVLESMMRMARGRRRIPTCVGALAVAAFLIATSIPAAMFWHGMLVAQTTSQMTIASYLETLPNYTRIYYTNSANLAPIYMGYNNASRFILYDNLPNCTGLLNNSYVIMPSFVQVSGVNYTPDPLKSCPYWRLVLQPNLTVNSSSYYYGLAYSSAVRLWYIT